MIFGSDDKLNIILDNKIQHTSASPEHYDTESETYDLFNEENSKIINQTLVNILKKYNIQKVIDISCGTGSQVFYLHLHGFNIEGYDINEKMLEVARKKALELSMDLKFAQGDMRTVKTDSMNTNASAAIITIFNSIGHLTKEDFEKTLMNINSNLPENGRKNGLYIFDIFNLDYLLANDNITKLTIDWISKTENCVNREIQYSTVTSDGILTSYDIYLKTDESGKMSRVNAEQTLQIYSLSQLKEMSQKAGFKVIEISDIDGSEFHQYETDRMLVVLEKMI